MDQVKAFFRAAGKQIFWVACGVILAVCTASWFFAGSNLQEEFDTNLGKIDGKMKTVATLMQTQDAPNEHSHAEMERVNNEALKLVLEAWQLQYSHQEGILQWRMELGSDFVAAVRPLKPIESKVDFPTPIGQELKVDFRMRYANYVERLLPKLAEVVGTRWMVGSRAGRRSTMPTQSGQPGPLPSGQMPIVEWDQTDQSRLLAGHFDWSSQPDSAPTTLQVLYAQEDLWILTALVGIIARTNEGAESRHDAVVKTIRSMRIGRGVTGRSGQITRLGTGSGGGFGGGGMYEGMGEEGSADGDSDYMSSSGGGESASAEYEMGGSAMGGGAMSGSAMGGMEMGGGEMGEGEMGGSTSTDPGQARYVDNEYNPLSAARVREALQSGAPEDAFLVVAKRMPIRLQLIVDQRKLPRLMVEFGNSPLPVEVRQVRVNRSSGSSGGGGMGEMGGMGGGMGGMGGSMGGMGGSMGEMGGSMGEMGGSMGGMGGGMGGMGGGGYSPDYGGAEGNDTESEMGYGGMGGGDYGTGFGGGYGGMGNMQNRTNVSSTTSHDVPVEVYGIIYIYNPVDKAKLGLQDTTSMTSVAQPSENTAG